MTEELTEETARKWILQWQESASLVPPREVYEARAFLKGLEKMILSDAQIERFIDTGIRAEKELTKVKADLDRHKEAVGLFKVLCDDLKRVDNHRIGEEMWRVRKILSLTDRILNADRGGKV